MVSDSNVMAHWFIPWYHIHCTSNKSLSKKISAHSCVECALILQLKVYILNTILLQQVK